MNTNKSVSSGRRNLSVSARISIGFLIVMVLHVLVAVLSHYGLSESQANLAANERIRHESLRITEIEAQIGELQRNVLLYTFTQKYLTQMTIGGIKG